LKLAYAGQFDEQNRYYQPFSYKPAPSDVLLQPSPTVPSSIDNWSDYAAYLANNPDALSAQTRSVVMRIALNNANRPGDDKILRTSHHQMPVTWSLALKYRLNHRFALESGLSYSCLTSDFETGADGRSATAVDTNLGKNAIREQQTIHYLGIPMKGIYNMYGGKRWNIYGSLGLTTEMPVHSTLRSDFYVNGQHEATDKTTIRAPWQFSTTFGLGLQMHLTPHIGFFAEPSLQYYIPTKSSIETYRTEHPFTFSLPLGIRFTW
jgi:RNA polymerase sigma-70 factor (ECF subfamily)